MKNTLVLALSLLSFTAACGDDSGGNNNDHPDAGPGSDSGPLPDAGPSGEKAVVVSGDFATTGTMAALYIGDKTLQKNVAPATAVGVDPVMRKFGNELFVVNRNTENSLTILKASDYSLVEQVGIGAGTNPQDVAVVGNKVYVATYTKGLTYFTRGSTTTAVIDLSSEDPDGNPNCASVYAVGTKLFVTCQLLNNSVNPIVPRGPGKVYVIDTTTNTKTATLTLETQNPFSLLAQLPAASMFPNDLIVGTVKFSDGSGCIERISTGATPAAEGCIIDNEDNLDGGFAQRFDFSATTAYAVVGRADFSGADVRTLALADNTIAAAALNPTTQPIGDVAVCPSGKVVVTEQPPFGAPTTAPKGLRIYSATGTEITTSAVDFGLAPGSTWGLTCYE